MGNPYRFPLETYMSEKKFQRIKDFTADKPTPCLVIDLDVIRDNYAALRKHLPFAKVYYAVKANPTDEVVSTLRDLGSSFDVATRFELDQLLRLGVSPELMSFGNTIKKDRDIAYFYEKGVRLYVSDSMEDLEALAKFAPGSRVFFRILTDGLGADWPLSRKFGSHPDLTRLLILKAKKLGLEPYGISFHVGSQQRDVGQWSSALMTACSLFQWSKEHDIELKLINMGGGFPANYVDPTRTLEEYAADIKIFLTNNFGPEAEWPEIIFEPGRSMAGDAGVIVTEVVNIAKKSLHDVYRWVFFDVGKFGGMIETLDEALKYPIYFQGKGETEEVIIAGPTCDSMDILYEKYRYEMPDDVKRGDRVYILTTGAYTQSYSSVYFNGFPPLAYHVLG